MLVLSRILYLYMIVVQHMINVLFQLFGNATLNYISMNRCLVVSVPWGKIIQNIQNVVTTLIFKITFYQSRKIFIERMIIN